MPQIYGLWVSAAAVTVGMLLNWFVMRHSNVVNSGYNGTLNGELETVIGKAKQPNPKYPGKLKVSFFWIFYAQYNILELDQEEYSYALIGSSNDK